MQYLRAGRGCDGVIGGFLCCVPFMVVFKGSLKDTFRAVFLKPPWPYGREVLCGWSRSSSGVAKGDMFGSLP